MCQKLRVFLCYSIRFYKFLILKYTNTFAFSSLNRNFAVTLHKNNKLSLIYLDGTKEF